MINMLVLLKVLWHFEIFVNTGSYGVRTVFIPPEPNFIRTSATMGEHNVGLGVNVFGLWKHNSEWGNFFHHNVTLCVECLIRNNIGYDFPMEANWYQG